MTKSSIINKFVNNLPIELHLADPLVGTYAACGPGTKHEERLQRYIQTGDTQHIFKNELDKACFFHDASYSKYKDVPNRQAADRILMDNAMKIAANESLDGYQRSLAGMIYKFFEKKIQMGQGWTDELAEELHKPIRRKFQRRSVQVSSIDEVWGADLVDMKEWKKENKGYTFILTVIDVFSKYAWAVPLKDKKGETVKKAFEKIIGEHRTPQYLWVDQGSEFYNKTMNQFLDKHDIKIYSTFGEHKSAVIERFNRTLKTNMWKRFTAENTRNWINMLPELIKKYNEKKHATTTLSPIEASKEENEPYVFEVVYKKNSINIASPKFKVGDSVRISRVKGMFEKGYLPNWSEETYKIVKVKPTTPATYVLQDWNGDVIRGSFYEQELQKTTQNVFRIEKIIRKKKIKGVPHGLVKWLGYSKKFNEWLPMSTLSKL